MAKVFVVLIPVLQEVDPKKFGVYENLSGFRLCEKELENDKSVASTIVNMIKELVPVDIRKLSIIPVGFFDSFQYNQEKDRKISLVYKLHLFPGTPISTNIGFKTYDELGTIDCENSKEYCRIIRAATSI